MKKLICVIIAAAAALSLIGCGSASGNNIVDIFTPQPGTADVIVPVPTDVPDFTPAPTEAATPVPTEAPSASPTEGEPTAEPTQNSGGEPDQAVFDDAVFIGNSIFEGLYRFGIISHGKFFTKVGLNVNSVMTDHADGSTVPVIDELNGIECGKVVILLGTNELGWPSYTTFIQKYSDLLDAVWERQPGARIYITGLPPVQKKVDDEDKNGINNANIRKMNSMLEELASRRGAVYIDVPAELYDSADCLPEDASSDGIHLNLKYDRIWADHITLKVMGAI